MKIEVKELRPNPFRHLERYPIDPDKVEALKQSIKETSFWDNLLARKSPNGAGGYELAYGHHRLAALKKAGIDEIDIPVRPLTDTKMAQIMSYENMEEWGTNAVVEQETVRAIVEGFAEGKIELPTAKQKDGSKNNTRRYAPSFMLSGSDSERQESEYTAVSLAKFTGKPEARIEAILNSLAVIEKGLVEQEDFEGLSTYQGEAVARQVRRIEKETGEPKLAKAIGKRLASGMRSATGHPGKGGKKKSQQQAITLHGARRAANEMMGSHRRKTTPKEYPSAGKAIPKLASQIADLPSEQMQKKLELVFEVRKELHQKDLAMLIGALRGLAKRAIRFADRLEG